MIAYNHEKYIAQAIEGVLSQRTTFPLELVIGEDYSSDNTRTICKEFANENPNLIRVISRRSNVGMSRNFADTLSNCKGRFVALCDGDDYWTDIYKLQKQVDFFEKNEEFAICFHRVSVRDELTGELTREFYRDPDDITDIKDLLTSGGHYIPTASCMIRNFFDDGFPSFFNEYAMDIVLYLLAAAGGKIKFIDENMAVYRIHNRSYSGTENRVNQLQYVIDAVNRVKDHFHPSFEGEFNVFIGHARADIAFHRFDDGDYESFRRFYNEFKPNMAVLHHRTRRALLLRAFMSRSRILSGLFHAVNRNWKSQKLVG